MSPETRLVEKLETLNEIAASLNRAIDVRAVLDGALASVVALMGLDAGWITLVDPEVHDPAGAGRYKLAAYHNLPPALDPASERAWGDRCTCQRMADEGELTGAYNEVHCSRLDKGHGDRRGLAVHASAPLRAGDRTLGILNVAGPDWSSFTPEALALLTAAGSQMGVAIERAQLYDLLRERRVQEQAALLDLSNNLLRGMALSDLVTELLDQVHRVLEADAVALLLPDPDASVLRFAAAQGWHTDPVVAGRQVPLDGESGPALVMRSGEPLATDDLWASDPTDWAPDWLMAEGFRGHAVVPLLVDNRPIGVLVANQRRPRCPEADDMRLLQLMANQGAVAIEKARLHDKELAMKVLERELAVGREIQLSLLPGGPPRVPGWDVAVYYEPAHEVGGDFYDFVQTAGAPDHLGVVIADVSGKGVPAALFMARICASIHTAVLQGQGPAQALARANALVTSYKRAPMLVTALHADLDVHTGRLTYANAGHLRPLLHRASTGALEELSSAGILLGAVTDLDLQEAAIDVAPGDVVVFYTDGVTEAMDASGNLFGDELLAEMVVLATESGAGAQQVVDTIVGAVTAHNGTGHQSDDLTLVVVRREPAVEDA